ncbi:MAG: hypothetical protein ACRDSL_22755 [Pseudonocardiaceae bacterium]
MASVDQGEVRQKHRQVSGIDPIRIADQHIDLGSILRDLPQAAISGRLSSHQALGQIHQPLACRASRIDPGQRHTQQNEEVQAGSDNPTNEPIHDQAVRRSEENHLPRPALITGIQEIDGRHLVTTDLPRSDQRCLKSALIGLANNVAKSDAGPQYALLNGARKPSRIDEELRVRAVGRSERQRLPDRRATGAR